MRVLVALLLCVALDANAIVRRHDRNDATYVARAKGLDAVVNMNLPRGAGTLIAPEWILTQRMLPKECISARTDRCTYS